MASLPTNAGSFSESVQKLWDCMNPCTLCPRNCKVNRGKGQIGFCGIGDMPVVSSVGPHFGEEPPLVGTGGSGTIFLTGCNLGCMFCQNYDISHLKNGRKINLSELVDTMLNLEKIGCHNINFVTPTHFTPQIMKAIYLAREKGLIVPIVYNCGGYELLETIKLLEGFIEIYMPDAKYADSEVAKELSNAPDYPDIVKKALIEMHRQVGDLAIDGEGIAKKGLLIRHLVLPNNLAGTERIMDFIAKEISKDSYVNIMDQYRPMYKAQDNRKINRYITPEEYEEAVNIAKHKGLHRGF